MAKPVYVYESGDLAELQRNRGCEHFVRKVDYLSSLFAYAFASSGPGEHQLVVCTAHSLAEADVPPARARAAQHRSRSFTIRSRGRAGVLSRTRKHQPTCLYAIKSYFLITVEKPHLM